jgi:mannose-6-phosphate isomerase-like protein (cupin superfamily)
MVGIISRDIAEHYRWGGVCDGWHLLKSEALSIIQERVPPGGCEEMHFHEHAHQFFFVLSGEATMEIGGERLLITSEHGVSVPAGVHHRLLNQSNTELWFLVISSPRSHGDRVSVK